MKRKKTIRVYHVYGGESPQIWIATKQDSETIRLNLISPTMLTWLAEHHKVDVRFIRNVYEIGKAFKNVLMGTV